MQCNVVTATAGTKFQAVVSRTQNVIGSRQSSVLCIVSLRNGTNDRYLLIKKKKKIILTKRTRRANSDDDKRGIYIKLLLYPASLLWASHGGRQKHTSKFTSPAWVHVAFACSRQHLIYGPYRWSACAIMAGTAEEAVFSALRGHLSENTKLPTPLIIKVYVASLKKGMYAQRVQFIVGEASFAVVCISYYGRHESFDTTAVCVCVCDVCRYWFRSFAVFHSTSTIKLSHEGLI